MIRLARRLVYWLGFDPKPGTILHSPSRWLQNRYREFHADLVRGIEEGAARIREVAAVQSPSEKGVLARSALDYPTDPVALGRRIRAELEDLYGPQDRGNG
jgi:hypothetical protein